MSAVRVALVGAALAAAVLATTSARAADECRGLMVCIPVSGPWVVMPVGGAQAGYPQRSWHMKCPPGSIVGGVDGRLTDRTIDMSFAGLLGSPVNPGVTTTSEVVFTGVRTGARSRPAAFRPFVGCIPTAGGGRVPTAVKPGRPTILRVRAASVPGGSTVTLAPSCRPGERLVSWTHAVGLRQRQEPTSAQLRGVRSTLVRGGRAAQAAAARGLRARLQIVAVCARGPTRP